MVSRGEEAPAQVKYKADDIRCCNSDTHCSGDMSAAMWKSNTGGKVEANLQDGIGLQLVTTGVGQGGHI